MNKNEKNYLHLKNISVMVVKKGWGIPMNNISKINQAQQWSFGLLLF
ncbi:hypothetical protein [Erysipelothrix piscisicarius]